MNIRSKTYRFLSALTLIFFLSSFVLPAGLSAAALFCDMPMTAMHNSSEACCDIQDAENADHHRTDTSNEHCNEQQICLHSVSQGQPDEQSAIIYQVKDLTLLAVVNEIEIGDNDRNISGIVEPSLSLPNYSPPIFLLNSTFLN